MNVIYCAYEGDDLLGKFATAEEADEACEVARREAGPMARKRLYRVESRQRRGGELEGGEE